MSEKASSPTRPASRRNLRGVAIALEVSLLLGGTVACDSGGRQHEGDPKISRIQQVLGSLAVKGRAPKTGYSRDQFSSGWATVDGCDMRERILQRDLTHDVLAKNGCTVLSGTLDDPVSGKKILFKKGPTTSDDVQIDHVVPLGNAWQTGAQQLTKAERYAFANDPRNLEAIDGPTNSQKSDGDIATWQPPNKADYCTYVYGQIDVKDAYHLWVTQPEFAKMTNILDDCTDSQLHVPAS